VTAAGALLALLAAICLMVVSLLRADGVLYVWLSLAADAAALSLLALGLAHRRP
jgi:hypothetical protein